MTAASVYKVVIDKGIQLRLGHVGEFSNHMQVVVKLSVYEGEVMHNIWVRG